MPQPVYISLDYTLTLKSNYQQQMNQMLQPFITLGGHINSFLIEHEGHSYEVFMQSEFGHTNNITSYNDEGVLYGNSQQFDPSSGFYRE